MSDSLHLVFISDYFFLDVFDLITGSDSVDPGTLDPANCGRGGEKVSFVLFQEFTNKESLW